MTRAQFESHRLVVLTDIVARYMMETDHARETRQDTLQYLADLLVTEVVAVESALEAAPNTQAETVSIEGAPTLS